LKCETLYSGVTYRNAADAADSLVMKLAAVVPYIIPE